jgi:hypothetical protein
MAAAIVSFIDNLGRLLACVDNVNIGLVPGSIDQRLSPGIFDLGVFGSMLDLTASPPTRSAMAIWRQVPGSLNFDISNHIRDFFAPPWVMIQFNMEVAVPRALLLVARGDARVGSGMGDVLYFFYGYIGNLQYCFEFAPLCTRENLILANPLHGRMTCYLEAIPPKGELPPDGVNGWVALRREDASSGEGGSSVTRPTRAVTGNGANGAAEARGGGAAALGGPQGLP